MRNKRFLAMVLAAVSTMSLFNGCDSDKESSSDKTGKESSSSVSSEEDKPLSDNISIMDKVYRDYLEQQKLCTISKGFEILEPGVARDNPNGLAGAVKYDFDGDKKDELVTFTFERNNTNGEDIRIDLLKVNDDGMKVADSKYLTEILEIDDSEWNIKSDSIYFTNDISMEIVTSEYNDKLYFGSIISYDGYYTSPGATSPYFKSFSVFSIEDGKITPCTIAGKYLDYVEVCKNEYDGVLYSTLLPPSIRDTTEKIECKPAEEEFDDYEYYDSVLSKSKEVADEINTALKEKENAYIMYADVHAAYELSYLVNGGVYDSATSAYSALLNEFGLDIEYVNTREYDDFERSVRFVSKNQSTIKTILSIDAVRGYSEGFESQSEDNMFIGSRLTLSSDLETLLGDDAIFTEPFADEEELYNDIFRYPHYYRDVWDKFGEVNGYIKYFVADINSDGKKELFIGDLSDNDVTVNKFVVVNPDLTLYSVSYCGGFDIYDNGVISITTMTGGCMVYCDTVNQKHYVVSRETGDLSEYDNNDTLIKEISGEESDKIISELMVGISLNPEYESYSLYSPQNFTKLNVVEDVEDIKFGWEEAYLAVLENINSDFKDSTKASLMHLDNNDIPELYIYNTSSGLSLYTYHNGAAINLGDYGNRGTFEGYIEKGNYFCVGSTYSEMAHTCAVYSFNSIENGKLKEITSFSDSYTLDGKLQVNGEQVSKDEYEKQEDQHYDKLTHELAEYTYDEIIKVLNGEEVEKPAEDNNSSDSDKAKVKADGGLNMRSGAGKEFDKVTLIPDGSEVEILEKQSEWTKVKYKDYTGWVSNEFLK